MSVFKVLPDPDTLGLLLLAIGLGVVIGVQLLAMATRRDRDAGILWAWMLTRLGLFWGTVLVFCAAFAALIPQWWESCIHPFSDLAIASVVNEDDPICGGKSGLKPHAQLQLLIPFVLAAILTLVSFLRLRGADPEETRHLAGAVGFRTRRFWVVPLVIPLAIILLYGHSRLNTGSVYPAHLWSLGCIFLLGLLGVAASTVMHDEEKPQPTDAGTRSVQPGASWVADMQAAGLNLRPLHTWTRDAPREPPRPRAHPFNEWIADLGAREVAPGLVRAMSRVLSPQGESEQSLPRTALIRAPDDCGQVEITVGATIFLARQQRERVLVITSGSSTALARSLSDPALLPSDIEIFGADPDQRLDLEARLLVFDADTLAHQLLPALAENPTPLQSIGMIIWWDLHGYTGVLAANMWAISRRLHRMVEDVGREDVPVVCFMREPEHGGAQLSSFVRRLLPVSFPENCEITVAPWTAREIELVEVGHHHPGFLASAGGQALPSRGRHPILLTTLASVHRGWALYSRFPPQITDSERNVVLESWQDQQPLKEHLAIAARDASVQLLTVTAENVLSLPALLCTGGRTRSPTERHVAALLVDHDPYVQHLVRNISNASQFGRGYASSRFLMGARGTRRILQRHLLHALNEMNDTHYGLRRVFNWEEELIQDTLAHLGQDGNLESKPVRFLNPEGRLEVDREYQSRITGSASQPLDTVDAELIQVRDPAAANASDHGLRLQVDPDRLTIAAYPQRVFEYGGRRFRIREWTDLDAVKQRRQLECQLEDLAIETHRVRSHQILHMELDKDTVRVGSLGSLARTQVHVVYGEKVTGVIELRRNPDNGELEELPSSFHTPISQEFETQGLLLELPQGQGSITQGLTSVCQALRHVVPVHLGVRPDALEVVAQEQIRLANLGIYKTGILLVDLFPGGIGLVEAFSEDNSLVLDILKAARSWLQACPCKSDHGCPQCLRPPAYGAIDHFSTPSRGAALDILTRMD